MLGAGNFTTLAVGDALELMIGHNKVVLIKTNPVNDYNIDFLRSVLAPLIDAGFLAIVTGGAEVGRIFI